MKVNLNRYPAYASTRVVDFPKLDGGLNIRELNYRLENNQSPSMKNLWWQDGVLQCRDGQRWLSEETGLGTGWAAEERLFYGAAFFHIGSGLWWADMAEAQARTRPWAEIAFSLQRLCGGVAENAGSFFRYGDCLYYKNRADSSSYSEILEDIRILRENGHLDEEAAQIEKLVTAEREGLND